MCTLVGSMGQNKSPYAFLGSNSDPIVSHWPSVGRAKYCDCLNMYFDQLFSWRDTLININ